MTLKVRFCLLLAGLFAALLVSLAWIDNTHHRETQQLAQKERAEKQQILERLQALTTYPLRHFTRDYSLWDDMVRYVAEPSDEWARINLTEVLPTFNLAATAVYRADGSLVGFRTRERAPVPVFPFSPADVLRLTRENAFATFFLQHAGALYEIQFAPVQPSADSERRHAPLGWLVGAKTWDKAHVDSLGETAGGRAFLEMPATGAEAGPSELRRELRGMDGKTVAVLRFSYENPQSEVAERFNREEFAILLLHGGVTLVLLLVSVHRWIVRPYRKLSTAMTTQDTQVIVDLKARVDEVGTLARLVQHHLEDEAALEKSQRALQKALEERIRLGRELHDGVIQSLYASGMGLVAARHALREAPHEAEERVEAIRVELNQAISRLRDFIHGLEPVELEQRYFSQAVRDLLSVLGGSVQGLQPTALIDDAAAESLPLTVRAVLLEFIRDAVQLLARERTLRMLAVKLAPDAAGISLAVVAQADSEPSRADAPGLQASLTTLVSRLDSHGMQSVVKVEGAAVHLQLKVPQTVFP